MKCQSLVKQRRVNGEKNKPKEPEPQEKPVPKR